MFRFLPRWRLRIQYKVTPADDIVDAIRLFRRGIVAESLFPALEAMGYEKLRIGIDFLNTWTVRISQTDPSYPGFIVFLNREKDPLFWDLRNAAEYPVLLKLFERCPSRNDYYEIRDYKLAFREGLERERLMSVFERFKEAQRAVGKGSI